MATYAYSIYDADPSDAEYPLAEYDSIEVESRDDTTIGAVVARELEEAANGLWLEDYEPGDRLWLRAWDFGGVCVAALCIELTREHLNLSDG